MTIVKRHRRKIGKNKYVTIKQHRRKGNKKPRKTKKRMIERGVMGGRVNWVDKDPEAREAWIRMQDADRKLVRDPNLLQKEIDELEKISKDASKILERKSEERNRRLRR